MNLALDRPLAFFDLETTGINPYEDRIVEIGVVKLNCDGTREERCRRLNPGVPIPAEATAVHGISNDDVRNEPSFRQIARSLDTFLAGADLSGFNIIRFDVPLLIEEFRRAGITFTGYDRRLIDAQRIFHKQEPRDLTAALKFYCGAEHTDAHGVAADVDATIRVLTAQLERYGDLPKSVDALDQYCQPRDPDAVDREGKLKWTVDGEVAINFGEQKGKTLAALATADPGFLEWILRSRFSGDVKGIVYAALEGRFPSRNSGDA
jgi:DNA polymerase-3 subunit epsilon